jgi:hypothetical protein
VKKSNDQKVPMTKIWSMNLKIMIHSTYHCSTAVQYYKNLEDFYYPTLLALWYVPKSFLQHMAGGEQWEKESLNATLTTPNPAHKGHLWHFLKFFEKNYIGLLVRRMYFITIIVFSNFIYKRGSSIKSWGTFIYMRNTNVFSNKHASMELDESHIHSVHF